jgi:hypothetical protein
VTAVTQSPVCSRCRQANQPVGFSPELRSMVFAIHDHNDEVDRHAAINRLTDSIASGALSDGHVRLVLELVAALTGEAA